MAFRCSAQARKFCVLSQWCQESSKNLPCGKPLPHLQESNQSRHLCGLHNYRDSWKHRMLLFSSSALLTFTLFESKSNLTVELTRRRESKHPSPHQASYK